MTVPMAAIIKCDTTQKRGKYYASVTSYCNPQA